VVAEVLVVVVLVVVVSDAMSSLLLGVRSGRVGFMALRPAGVVRAGLSRKGGVVVVVVWASSDVR
jgi:hypothetical protein